MSIFEESKSYRPFKYSWAVEAERVHRIDMNWNEAQLDLADDLRQYTSKDELATQNVSHEVNKNILDKSLMLFTEMDVSVGGGYAELLPHVKNNEIRTLWFTFAAREVTHQRAYAVAAETFGFNNSDWSNFKEYKEMQDKIDLLCQDLGDLSNKLNFCKKLSTVLLGEGIALFGAFSNLLNLSRFGKLMGFNSVNEWSLKDEQDHVSRNIQILNEARKELTEQENQQLNLFIIEMIDKFVQAEHKYFDLIFELGEQEDYSKQQAKAFISYLGRLRGFQLGILKESDVGDNPIEWIDYILSGNTHVNFFENKVVDYSHDGLKGEVNYDKYLARLEERYLN